MPVALFGKKKWLKIPASKKGAGNKQDRAKNAKHFTYMEGKRQEREKVKNYKRKGFL